MRRLRPAGWGLVVLLLAGLALRARGAAGATDATRAAGAEARIPRLLGPFSHLAASVQWVRVHGARRAGRLELALARAEVALRLDPVSPEGWSALASHLGFDRASPAHEPDPARRLGFLRAGIWTAARGEQLSSHPEELAHLQGLILIVGAANQPDLAWPGGLEALWGQAEEHFDRAESLGHPHGAEGAEYARSELARLRAGD